MYSVNLYGGYPDQCSVNLYIPWYVFCWQNTYQGDIEVDRINLYIPWYVYRGWQTSISGWYEVCQPLYTLICVLSTSIYPVYEVCQTSISGYIYPWGLSTSIYRDMCFCQPLYTLICIFCQPLYTLISGYSVNLYIGWYRGLSTSISGYIEVDRPLYQGDMCSVNLYIRVI